MEPPIKPNESDCCNSGCNPCILDVYEEQLKLYQQRKVSLKVYTNCISPTSYTLFELINVEKQSEDTSLYTFKYVKPLRGKNICTDLRVQYNPGQHFLLKACAKGEEFTRAYTPIPIGDDNPLQFTTLIKLYKTGKMSEYLRAIQTGNQTLWRGPYGDFKINYNHKFLFLIAQGTGIAPIFSILHDMVNKEDCFTFIKLFYCCRYGNIYLSDQLYKLSSNWNFTYEIFVNNSVEDPPARYNEIIHYRKLQFNDINTYLLHKFQTTNVVICGTQGFNEDIKKYVLHCKVADENVFTFT